MNTFVVIVIFCAVYSFVSYLLVYSCDTVDTANSDYKDYNPGLYELSEEERASYCIVDDYIKNTICPAYHYQILRNEINHYQNDDNGGFCYYFIINLMLSLIFVKILDIEKWFFFCTVVALVIGYVCYFVVWLLYKKYSPYRIIGYYELHPSYDWKSHYDYLLKRKENVIYRYLLRNIVLWIGIFSYVLAVFNNII